MARLQIVTAEGGQQAVELRAVNSLGRHPNNSIQLLDKIVSKEHCIIEQRGDHFVLRDLGSLNGSYLNAEQLRKDRRLVPQDEVRVGRVQLVFIEDLTQLPDMPQPRPTKPDKGGDGLEIKKRLGNTRYLPRFRDGGGPGRNR